MVGSSKKRILGECTKAIAKSNLRRIPPLYLPTRRSTASRRSTKSINSSALAAACLALMPNIRACRVNSSADVINRSRPMSCRATPAILRTCLASVTVSKPPTLTEPLVGRDSVVSIDTVVLLPAPLGPRKPKISPGCTSKDTPSTAKTESKRLLNCSAMMPLCCTNAHSKPS